jgi:hypothetical protein
MVDTFQSGDIRSWNEHLWIAETFLFSCLVLLVNLVLGRGGTRLGPAVDEIALCVGGCVRSLMSFIGKGLEE